MRIEKKFYMILNLKYILHDESGICYFFHRKTQFQICRSPQFITTNTQNGSFPTVWLKFINNCIYVNQYFYP